MGLLLVSFLAGALTVLAPCILPLLPVIVGGSLTEGSRTRRVAVIVVSLGVSVFLFTLVLKVSTAFVTIPQFFWQLLSGCLLILFGVATLFPELWDRIPFVNALYRSSNKVLGTGYQKQNVWGDIVVGAALGPVFSSCSPTYFLILAAVLPVHLSLGLTYLFAYVVGLCLCLYVVALLGQRVALALGVAADPHGWLKKIIGALFVVVGIAIVFGLDKKLEAMLPAGAFGEINIEQQLLVSQSGTSSTTPSVAQASAGHYLTSEQKATTYPKAPELAGIAGYINTDGQPIALSQYVGKSVVLVDFWDYSCINCQRTTPYLNAWYQKYKDQGLVIVGVHTPEFAFEQQLPNVEAAVKASGIQYPVVLDNMYKTWGAFQNQYWPNEYLIDIDGYVVHEHAGEGEYDQTEMAIQQALGERAARLKSGPVSTSTVDVAQQDLSNIQSPETYFGAARNVYLGNGAQHTGGSQTLTLPLLPSLNVLYLGGTWNFSDEYAEAGSGATVLYEFNSSRVYMVATNPLAPVKIKVLLDGKPVGANAGSDVDAATSEATITGDRLYNLVQEKTAGVHILEIQIEQGTLDAYTFTFG